MARNVLREILLLRRCLNPMRSSSHGCWPLSLHHAPSIRPLHLSSASRFAEQQTSQKKISEDRIEMFVDPEVQELLRSLTGKDYQKVFRNRKTGQKLREPKYTFMTEEQLQETLKEAEDRADHLLQMPPVLRPRQPIQRELSFDPELQGLEESTLIFTDISPNVPPRKRLIVARDPDGTLRQATWEERDKMNAIYFPRDGKEFLVPRMFSDPEIYRSVLNRASDEDNTYEFVLDRACLQFEPDDPQYIAVCEETYNTIDSKKDFDLLKSSRHYGPMLFYLVRTRKMDNLLMHSIQFDRVETDALGLVTLFHKLFPESKSSMASQGKKDKLRAYIELDSIRRSELELALNAYEEAVKNRQELSEDIAEAHGIQQKNS